MQSEIKVYIPANNIAERQYIIEVLLGEFLGISYQLYVDEEIEDYYLNISDNQLIIRDGLWKNYPEMLSYLCEFAFPKVFFIESNPFTTETDIAVIYGTQELEITSEKIVCGIDIFASSFFYVKSMGGVCESRTGSA